MGLFKTIGKIFTGNIKNASSDLSGIPIIGDNQANIKYQREANQQSIDFQKEMYDRQRKDAVSDWEMNNRYNTPAQQMQRYKEAGLNPNLIYGNATNSPSAMVRSSSAGSPNITAPQQNSGRIAQAIGGFYDLAVHKAQLDQTKQVTKNLEVDNLLKQLNVVGIETKNKSSIIDLKYREEMVENILKGLKLANVGKEIDQTYQGLTMNYRVQEVAQRLANAQKDGRLKDQMLKNLTRQEDLARLDYLLKSNGLDGNDPLYLKSMFKFLTTGNADDVARDIKNSRRQLNRHR